jgi:hypothetical protein
MYSYSYSQSIYHTKKKTQKQKQTLLFLEFKAYSLIYYNLLLKVNNFIIRWSQNPIKRDCFTGVRSSTTNHKLHKLLRKEY